MKYSLGASISISLFLRICCSVEVNNLASDHGRFDLIAGRSGSGRSENVYERYLKLSIMNGCKNLPFITENHVNEVVDQWLDEMKFSNKSSPDKQRKITSSSLLSTRSSFDLHYCGILNPPNLTVPNCASDEHGCSTFEDVPSGCVYDEMEKELRCQDKQITELPVLPPVLNILDLNETKIQELPELAFKNVSINAIRLFRNSINSIHPYAFHDVENLRNLVIVDNEITLLAYEFYVGLNQTIFLDLRNNLISFEIYKYCPARPLELILPVLPQLRMLRLSGNPLNVIPWQMFAGLRNSPLNSLYLDNCYLTEIHNDSFSYLSETLELLELSGNPSVMSSLEHFLAPLEKLQILYLARNGLTRVPVNATKKFAAQMKVLELSGNVMNSIYEEDFSNFVSLEELYLDECGIISIAKGAFEKTSSLRVLSLRDNKLRQLPSFYPSLEYLRLTQGHQNLVQAGQRSFQNLTKLRFLELNGINLEKINKETFYGLSSLREMHLKSCNIKEIEQSSFQNLTKMRHLMLSSNPITSLNLGVFFGMNELDFLAFDNCQMSFPEEISENSKESHIQQDLLGSPTSFPYLPMLRYLDFTGNKIEYLTPSLFQNLPNLTTLDFSNNPVKSWSSRLFPERQQLVSEMTDEIPNFVLKLGYGSIHILSDAMIEDFLRMSTIDLSANKFICNDNACKLRDMINFSIPNWRQTWINSEMYECYDTVTSSNYRIQKLTDEDCQRSSLTQTDKPTGLGPSVVSSGLTKIISISAALAVIGAVVIILAYKNRVHLRYFMFYVKFNVMSASERKAKLSETNTEDGIQTSYDFDVFISYHHDDSNFVQDVFLPEIEFHNNNSDNVNGLNETKSSINFITNDRKDLIQNNNVKISLSQDNNKDKINPKQDERFKVCLHEREFAAGVPITENIVDCVDRSRKTVILVSRKYMESQWCSFEMNLAYHRMVERRRKAFVLVLMEEIPSDLRSKVLNYLMVSRTYLQWPGMNASEEEKIVFWKRLRSFLQAAN